MSAFFYYGSFPNSRIQPRPSTSQAQTSQVTVVELPSPLVKIKEADPNRTYLKLQNFSGANSVYYIYAAEIFVNPTIVPTFGVTGQIVYQSPIDQIYLKMDDGLTTNWVGKDPSEVGELILPQATVILESPETVWGAVNSLVPATAVIGIDEGLG